MRITLFREIGESLPSSLLIALVLCLFTVVIFLRVVAYVRALASSTWLVTTGTVIAIEPRGFLGTAYMIGQSLRYEYEVGGRYYEGNRIGWGNPFDSDQAFLRSLGDVVGKRNAIQVLYDPVAPSRSVLARKASRHGQLAFIVFLVLGCIFILLVAETLKR